MRPEPRTNPGMKTRIGSRPYRATTVLSRPSLSPGEAFPVGQAPEVSHTDSPATSEFESSIASDVIGSEPVGEEVEKVASKGHVYVTGVPAVGKTTEANRLSKERGLPVVSLDGAAVKSTDDARKFIANLDSPHIVEGTQLLGLRPDDLSGNELVHLKQPKDVIVNRLVDRGWTDDSGELLRGEQHRESAGAFYDKMRGHEQDFEDRLGQRKIAEAVKKGPGEFAPGIPGDRGIHSIQKVRPKGPNAEWTASVSFHPAARRGDHEDLRLVDGKGRAHSWAFQTLPAPGKSTYAVQQPTHKKEYALRTKPFTIPEGYGATRPGAQVEPKFVSPVEVVEASNDKVRFLKHEGQNTQEFVVRKLVPSMGDIRPLWALHNATKNRQTGEGKKIPAYKPKYKEVAPESIDLNDQEQVMTPKMDGAHVLVDLPGTGDKFARVYSYRPTARETGLIEHTFKFKDFQKRLGSPEVKNTMIRAELWASDKDGKSIPAEQIGGILNAGVLKSRKKQEEMGVKLRLTGFDVVRHNGRNMENKPFAEKLDVLNKVKKVTRGFVEVPEVAATPEQKKKMLEQIKDRQRLDTDEGVVLHSLNKADAPVKAKFKPDIDVYVRKVFDKPKGKERGHAGGFEYSYTPDGPVVGRVGTGFDHNMRKDMLENPDRYVGRVAKVQSVRRAENITDTSQLNKALRAPSFQGWHLDKTDPKLMENDIEKGAQETTEQLRSAWLDVQNKLQPENVTDKVISHSRKLQQAKPLVDVVGKKTPVGGSSVHQWIRDRFGRE